MHSSVRATENLLFLTFLPPIVMIAAAGYAIPVGVAA
jgi:hypothetical protein